MYKALEAAALGHKEVKARPLYWINVVFVTFPGPTWGVDQVELIHLNPFLQPDVCKLCVTLQIR
jgi:hypothetical protein